MIAANNRPTALALLASELHVRDIRDCQVDGRTPVAVVPVADEFDAEIETMFPVANDIASELEFDAEIESVFGIAA